MNITYKFKIFWFEDQDAWLESEKEKLTNKFEESKIEFEIQAFRDASKLDGLTSETEIDIVLMDFNLSGTTGDQIITSLRTKNILCDIIFYSQQPNFHESLTVKEGVYTTARQNLGGELNKFIQKVITIIENVATIRGTFITSAIDLENKLNEIISSYFKMEESNSIFFKENIVESDFFTLGAKLKIIKRIGNDLLKHLEAKLQKASLDSKELMTKEKVRLEQTLAIFKSYDKEIMDIRNMLAHSKHRSGNNGETIFRHITKNEDYTINEKWVRERMKHLIIHSTNLDRLKTFL
jgi:response regulator RpfG family c-di-GMP phosphodiesterase